jgi:zinc dependent phospholipase C
MHTLRYTGPNQFHRCFCVLTALLLFLLAPTRCCAYSVLAHEALIDSAWDDAIKPLLLSRFPDATPEQLKEAHAYAYGGAVIQDMGYYPFGSKLFSDLVHYVRSGDFVEALLRDATTLDDYAFALGALAHYAADNNGHRIATNRAVPLLYPKLRKKYGDVITYDQNPAAHLKTEFGFDVLQVARGSYAPDDYHDRIGFQVSKPLLQQAFEETYSIPMQSIFTNYDLALGTYRLGVGSTIPAMTKVAWQIKKTDIQKEHPGETRAQFLYHLSRTSYRHDWGSNYKAPGLGTRLFAFLIRIIPKVGPFSALSFKTPTPAAEALFVQSFNTASDEYERLVKAQHSTGQLNLINDNFDVGSVTGPGEYPLADSTYADLLDRLASNHFANVSPELRAAVLDFYKDPNAPYVTKKNKKAWLKVQSQLDALKALQTSVGD